jgi:hypothetical protein
VVKALGSSYPWQPARSGDKGQSGVDEMWGQNSGSTGEQGAAEMW